MSPLGKGSIWLRILAETFCPCPVLRVNMHQASRSWYNPDIYQQLYTGLTTPGYTDTLGFQGVPGGGRIILYGCVIFLREGGKAYGYPAEAHRTCRAPGF